MTGSAGGLQLLRCSQGRHEALGRAGAATRQVQRCRILPGLCSLGSARTAQGAARELGAGGTDTNQHRSCWLLLTLVLEAGSWVQGPSPVLLPSRVRGAWAGTQRSGTSVLTVQDLVVLQGCMVPVGSRRCACPHSGTGCRMHGCCSSDVGASSFFGGCGAPCAAQHQQPRGPALGVSGPALEQQQAVPSRGTAVCRGSAGAGSWGRHRWGHGSFPSLSPCPGLCSHARASCAWLSQAL